MTGPTLVAVGNVPSGLLHQLAEDLARSAGLRCEISSLTLDPGSTYNPDRGQCDCRRLLPLLTVLAGRLGTRVLGVAEEDLYSPIFTFVFGEAKLGGRAGLFSLHRLRPSVYGLPNDDELLRVRVRKEALHETGHLFGLVHCRAPECVMRFSGSAEEVDLKSDRFCPRCEDEIRRREAGVEPPRLGG